MRVLEVCVDLDGGGIDRYLYNYCHRIDDIDFDFAIVDHGCIGMLESSFLEKGCHIYRLPRLRNGIKRNYQALKRVMTSNHYDAVHVHLGYWGFNALRCAKKCGIKTRIVHAHIANEPESVAKKCIRIMLTILTRHYATDFAACGIKAAKWVWGEKLYKAGKIKIHNNAIETNQFAFNDEEREKYRKQLNWDDKYVIGHIGRICDQKNQKRLLDIFYKIKQDNEKAVLLLIGRNDDSYDLSAKIRELRLEGSVIQLGVRDDVSKLVNAFDFFLFPSKYEGLPFTLIEVECNGVPTLCSDIITDEILINNNVKAISLSLSDAKWADEFDSLAYLPRDTSALNNIKKAGYDVDEQAIELKNYYTKCIREKNNE